MDNMENKTTIENEVNENKETEINNNFSRLHNMKEKIENFKIVTGIKKLFNKILNLKIFSTIKEKTKNTANTTKNFVNNHENIKCGPTGDILYRFSKLFKKIFSRGSDKLNHQAEKTKSGKLLKKFIKGICIVALIAFAGLVTYCIKDVFLQTLMLIATCCAVIVCVELILKVLSVGMGCKI